MLGKIHRFFLTLIGSKYFIKTKEKLVKEDEILLVGHSLYVHEKIYHKLLDKK